MNRRFDIVFFDLGFTLVWFNPSMGDIVTRAWNDVGLTTTREQVVEAIRQMWAEEDAQVPAGFPATREFDDRAEYERGLKVMRLLGGTDETMVSAYLARVDQLFLEPDAICLYDDVIATLNSLQSAGYHRLGIISNWSWNLIDRCKQVGIDHYFEIIMASAYAGFNKPHPGIFAHTLAQVGVSPDRAIHIGDRYDADVLGARAAGLTGVLLDRKNEAGEIDCPVIQNLPMLIDWLVAL
jgi:putative hydrolase of the HAD superfamily